MLPFLRFLRDVRPAEPSAEADEDAARRNELPTAPEAHLAWLAGAPYARIRDTEEEDSRFATLIIPYH